MPTFDIATFRVSLAAEHESFPALQAISEAMNGLITAAVLGTLTQNNPDDGRVARARELLSRARQNPKARARFYPQFFDQLPHDPTTLMVEDENFDPRNPMDATIRYALNSWIYRTLLQADADLCDDMFSFAKLERVEHHSPLAIELSLIVGAALIPVILTYALLRTVTDARRRHAEVRLRDTEVMIKEEELTHRRIQTRILENVARATEEMDVDAIPKEAIIAAATVSTSPIADLSSSPLIGSVTLGLSTKPS